MQKNHLTVVLFVFSFLFFIISLLEKHYFLLCIAYSLSLLGFLFSLKESFLSFKSWRYLAQHDELTQILNRRGFFLQLKPKQYSIVFIDIIKFGELNNQHGYQHGDHVLQLFAAELKQNLRQHDLCARLGGDEFIALLAFCDERGANAFIQRLQQRIEKAALPCQFHFGIALIEHHTENTLRQKIYQASQQAKPLHTL